MIDRFSLYAAGWREGAFRSSGRMSPACKSDTSIGEYRFMMIPDNLTGDYGSLIIFLSNISLSGIYLIYCNKIFLA